MSFSGLAVLAHFFIFHMEVSSSSCLSLNLFQFCCIIFGRRKPELYVTFKIWEKYDFMQENNYVLVLSVLIYQRISLQMRCERVEQVSVNLNVEQSAPPQAARLHNRC